MSAREEARKALAVLMASELVGPDLPVQAVYNYMPATFNAQSPVVVVSSGGSARSKLTFSTMKSAFRVVLTLFVAYPAAGDNELEHATETRLDDLEELIADIVFAHNKTAEWKALSYADISTIESVLIGGKEYRREVIPLSVEVY